MNVLSRDTTPQGLAAIADHSHPEFLMARAASPSESAQSGRYEALGESAVEFVTARGGSVHEDQLVSHVFGRNASPKLWRSLLQSTLAAEDRLTYTADGR